MPRADWDIAASAARLHADALVWDQHTCLPLRPDASVGVLSRHAASGANVVSVNVGMDQTPLTDVFKVLGSFRQQIHENPDEFILVRDADDVLTAHKTGRLAISFDLEGSEPLDGQLSLVETYYELGVRTMLIAYNLRNRAGGGCHDDPIVGLTHYGRALVREMNRIGLIVDATHCSLQTSLDLCSVSTTPVVFSHSNPRALVDHERNVTDDQIRACAASGGVVGINGVGIFLGDNDTATENLIHAIEHVAGLVGVEHVGIGLDFVFDQEELATYLRRHREVFPGYGSTIDFFEPERLPTLTEALYDAGWHEPDIRAVLGENFLRVARTVWR